MKWIKASERLPGMFTEVEWRNHDGGDIPLGKRSPIDHYKRAGTNAGWHEWCDESPVPSEGKTAVDILKDSGWDGVVPFDENITIYLQTLINAMESYRTAALSEYRSTEGVEIDIENEAQKYADLAYENNPPAHFLFPTITDLRDAFIAGIEFITNKK